VTYSLSVIGKLQQADRQSGFPQSFILNEQDDRIWIFADIASIVGDDLVAVADDIFEVPNEYPVAPRSFRRAPRGDRPAQKPAEPPADGEPERVAAPPEPTEEEEEPPAMVEEPVAAAPPALIASDDSDAPPPPKPDLEPAPSPPPPEDTKPVVADPWAASGGYAEATSGPAMYDDKGFANPEFQATGEDAWGSPWHGPATPGKPKDDYSNPFANDDNPFG
jgi:hypothetical protein